MRNRSLVSEREFTRLVDGSLGRKLSFVFPLTNAQLDLTKRKISSNGSANMKHSEAMSDEIVTRVSMGLTVSRKTAKNIAVRGKNERILTVSRKKC